MLVVPFSSDYDQTFTVELGGDGYIIAARWNERAQLWTFNLTRDADQVQLLVGVPLLSGQDVLAPYGLGIGGILVTDLSGLKTDAGPDDLNDRVIAAYFTRDEMAFLAAAHFPGVADPGLIPPVPGTIAPPGFGTGVPGGGSGGGGGGGGGSVIVEGGITNVNVTNITGASPFGDPRPWVDNTGNEQLVMQWPKNVGSNPNPTLAFSADFSVDGSGTVRAYVGGSFGTLGAYGAPGGTLIGTQAVSGPGAFNISGTLPNPGGMTPIRITIQSSAPVTDVSISSLSGVLG